jgi:hypothetical protein
VAGERLFNKNLPFPHGQAIALAAPHFLDHHAAGSIAIVVAGALANARHVTHREIQIQAGLWSASQNIAASRIAASVPRKPVQNQGERAEIRIASRNLLISGLSNLLFRSGEFY